MEINTFVMGVPIRVTKRLMVETFDMLDEGLAFEHERFSFSMVIPNDNALNLPFHERVLHLFISTFFDPLGRNTPWYGTLITGSCTTSRLATRSIY